MIEEVKKILAGKMTLRGCDWCIDYGQFDAISKRICQLFEPKPDL